MARKLAENRVPGPRIHHFGGAQEVNRDSAFVGFSPLILSFSDVAASVGSLGEVMSSGEYLAERSQARARVT